MLHKIILSFVWLLFLQGLAFGHVAGVTDTGIKVSRSKLMLTYTVPEDNLKELPQDAFLQGQAAIIKAISRGFEVKNDNNICRMQHKATRVLSEIKSQQFIFEVDCLSSIKVLNIAYDLFYDKDETHKNFTRISILYRTQEITFSVDKKEHSIPVQKLLMQWQSKNKKSAPVKPPVVSNTHYFPLGLEHILFGFDHVLFLLALLLIPLSIKQILLLVTSFTIAHSITLALSVLDIVTLPTLWVEAVIALSIVCAAFANVFALQAQPQTADARFKPRVAMTFLFGLLHGFGFSYMLKQIGLGDNAPSALLFFNLGVEAGQLIIVLVAVPLLALLFKLNKGYRFAQGLSALIALMGLYWLYRRLIDVIF